MTGMKKTICIAVVLMFVLSACGSSDELSQSPAVGSKVTAVEQPPTTTVTDSTDLNDQLFNMPVYDRYGILGLKRYEAAAILANIEEVSSWRLVHENCSDQPIAMTMDEVEGRLDLTTTDDVVVHYSIGGHTSKLDDGSPTVYKMEPQPACEVEAWELKLPELARHAKSHPGWIDVERIVPLIEMHGNADPRFKDAKKADGFVHLLSIRDISLDQAGALLDEVMVKWRVVQRDCQYLAVTEDWRPGRVNLSVIDDLVVGWQVEGAGHAHGSTWCASNASDTDPVHGILGLDLSEAAAILDAKEVSWRLVGSECPFQPIAMTLDLVEGRLNLETMNGVVVYYSIEHMDGPDNVYKMEPQSICPDTPEN